MIRFCLCFFLIFSAAFLSPALGQQTTRQAAIIDQEYQIPDLSADAARFMERAIALRERFEKLKDRNAEIAEAETLTQALQGLYLPEDPAIFMRRYRIELNLTGTIEPYASWRNASVALFEDAREEESLVAAFGAYERATSDRQKASALDLMADAMLAGGKGKEGANLLHQSLAYYRTEARASHYEAVLARYDLRVIDLKVDVEGATPSACIVFSRKLKRPLPINAEDYLRFDSATDSDVRGSGDKICISGLRHGSEYGVTILAGLPGSDGGRLHADVERSFSTPDREARVNLGSGTHILPQTTNAKIPLKTVNTETVNLELYLVPDRGLVPFLSSGSWGANVSENQENWLRNRQGKSVWSGEVEIDNQPNKDVTTLIPAYDILAEEQPGIYALVATDANESENPDRRRRWQPQATQWLIVTDIGLSSLSGSDGLHLFARSLGSAKAMRNVRLKLIAQNNDVLAETTTDGKGYASFSDAIIRGSGGSTPVLVTAETRDGDYAVLRLGTPAFDLSDRGVSGRRVPKGLDAYLFAERGVYRPGDAVYLSALLRDAKAEAVAKTPLTLVVHRPDNVEAWRTTLLGDELGGYGWTYQLSPAARSGRWRATVIAGDETTVIGSSMFQVEDFVPERLEATIKSTERALRPDQGLNLTAQADFLYGAPASGLKGSVSLILEPDAAPYPDFADYRFGLVQDPFLPKREPTVEFTTDETGAAHILANLDGMPDTSQPLRARIVAEVRDISGRPVFATDSVPVRTRSHDIGIRADRKGRFAEGDEASFDIVTIDADSETDGKTEGGRDVIVSWIKEHHTFNWYRTSDNWQYRALVTDEVIAEEKVSTDPEGHLRASRPLLPGRYRLDVFDASEGNAATSIRFNVGWWSAAASPNVPDALELTLETSELSAGGRLRGHVKAPFEGRATIAIVSDRLHHLREINLSEKGGNFDFEVHEDWGPSAYVLVIGYRPGAGSISRFPVRSMGISWFSVDRMQREAKLEIKTPEVVEPRQKIKIPVQVTGQSVGTPMKVLLAAVDEGILSLTQYTSPDPADFYFGKRALGMDIRDLYGRLIRSEEGMPGRIRTGAGAHRSRDESNAQGITRRTTRTVALYQRDIVLDESGRATIEVGIPDFNGRLRLMAVAYGHTVVAQAERPLIIRDPLVADLLLPRFMAPGDEVTAALSLQNLSGKSIEAELKLSTEGEILDLSSRDFNAALEHGQRIDLPVKITATTAGAAELNLKVTGEGLKAVERSWAIAVRPAWPLVTERQVTALPPGEATAVTISQDADFYEGTATRSLDVLSGPNIDPVRMIVDLQRYHYWCTEQTVSKAFPSLFHDVLAGAYKLDQDKNAIASVIDRAIIKLQERQKANGGYGLWRASGWENEWLNVYVADFLTRAQENGYHVPDAFLNLTLSRMKTSAGQRHGGNLHAASYALYVLARRGEISASEVRYFADRFGNSILTRLGIGHLAAALQVLGEEQLAEEHFVTAIQKRRPRSRYLWDYGSDLRDGSALLALISEVQPGSPHIPALVEALETEFDHRAYFNTQEMAWITRATARLVPDQVEGTSFLFAGKPVSMDGLRWTAPETNLSTQQAIAFENQSSAPLRAVQTTRGTRKSAPAASANGFEISRRLYTLDGNPVSEDELDSVKQNERFVILIEGRALNNTDHDALIVDFLPAGFEIENTALGAARGTRKFDFLPHLSKPEFSDSRDDRFVAAINIGNRYGRYGQKFAVAYMVRAVTPGRYVYPGIFIEDMYKPQYRAIGTATRLIVQK